ncbi:hypothetical protein AOLI_G00156450 [Acnodon oligacanthus]
MRHCESATTQSTTDAIFHMSRPKGERTEACSDSDDPHGIRAESRFEGVQSRDDTSAVVEHSTVTWTHVLSNRHYRDKYRSMARSLMDTD